MGRRARRETMLPLVVTALCIVLFIALGAFVKTGKTLAFDERVHRAVRGPVPTAFEADDLSLRTRIMHLGPDIGTATVVVAPLTALALVGLHRRRAALCVAVSAVGALLLTVTLKGIFHRTRFGNGCCFSLRHLLGYLFPSTHTVITVVTYGLIAALVGAGLRGWRRAAVMFVFISLVAFVAVSLVYLNTHYLTDVIGGLLVGTAWLILSLQMLRMIEESTSDEGTDGEIPPSGVMNDAFGPLCKERRGRFPRALHRRSVICCAPRIV